MFLLILYQRVQIIQSIFGHMKNIQLNDPDEPIPSRFQGKV